MLVSVIRFLFNSNIFMCVCGMCVCVCVGGGGGGSMRACMSRGVMERVCACVCVGGWGVGVRACSRVRVMFTLPQLILLAP